jgi:hypothetical protein
MIEAIDSTSSRVMMICSTISESISLCAEKTRIETLITSQSWSMSRIESQSSRFRYEDARRDAIEREREFLRRLSLETVYNLECFTYATESSLTSSSVRLDRCINRSSRRMQRLFCLDSRMTRISSKFSQLNNSDRLRGKSRTRCEQCYWGTLSSLWWISKRMQKHLEKKSSLCTRF